MGRLTMALKDYNGDYKQFSFDMPDMTGVNFATIDGYHDDLVAGVNGVVLGTVREQSRAYERVFTPNVAPPADSVAQTNIAWVVKASDNVTGNVFTWKIPTADITTASGLLIANSEQHDPTATPWIAFKAAFNQAVLSPDGNPVTITEIFYQEN